MTDDQREKKNLILENQAKMLMNHFDDVQIFASVMDGERDEKETTTLSYQVGMGNWNSRFGQVKRFVINQEAQEAEDGAMKARNQS